ncbi:MAG: hypothetical protein HGB14_05845 [Anaerolineaceae bacterium]|nr:hypothetical protein [Anaerolineaceae bacterium]
MSIFFLFLTNTMKGEHVSSTCIGINDKREALVVIGSMQLSGCSVNNIDDLKTI